MYEFCNVIDHLVCWLGIVCNIWSRNLNDNKKRAILNKTKKERTRNINIRLELGVDEFKK